MPVSYDLTFPAGKGHRETLSYQGKEVPFYAYEHLVYVSHPKNAEYEQMNLYVPAAYLEGKTVNGYTAAKAPVFLPNGVGGYMPGEPSVPTAQDRMTHGPNASLAALARGYVVAAPAIRGRTTVDADGHYVGKAPALIVDYKAAVRYLRFNRNRLPAGNTDRIIANGTSAGGALSALLGATGNDKGYEPYLKEIGAAKARDDIFAASVYCPITDLDHADMAYEWIFNGINTYYQQKGQGGAPGRPLNAPAESARESTMTRTEEAVSGQLKKGYPAYLNSLKLKAPDKTLLTLDEDGNGSFRDYLKDLYLASAQKALDKGVDVTRTDWVEVDDGQVMDMDFGVYGMAVTRLKAAPAFDKLDSSSGENDEFGTEDGEPRHFTEFAMTHRSDRQALADPNVIALMNPLASLSRRSGKVARYWRIRHGSLDRDTVLAVPAELALMLQGQKKKVDFEVAWGKGHAGDYDLESLFDWIDGICK